MLSNSDKRRIVDLGRPQYWCLSAIEQTFYSSCFLKKILKYNKTMMICSLWNLQFYLKVTISLGTELWTLPQAKHHLSYFFDVINFNNLNSFGLTCCYSKSFLLIHILLNSLGLIWTHYNSFELICTPQYRIILNLNLLTVGINFLSVR